MRGGLFRMPAPRKKPQFRKLFIGEWLNRLGKKPVEAANAIGVTEPYMSEIISGKKKNPGHAILFDLSEWLGISMNDFYRQPPSRAAVEAVENLNPSQLATLGAMLDQLKRAGKK